MKNKNNKKIKKEYFKMFLVYSFATILFMTIIITPYFVLCGFFNNYNALNVSIVFLFLIGLYFFSLFLVKNTLDKREVKK